MSTHDEIDELSRACANDQLSVVKVRVNESGVNFKKVRGATCLHHAAGASPRCLAVLLENQCNNTNLMSEVNRPDDDDNTPLHWAVKNKQTDRDKKTDSCRLLLAVGAKDSLARENQEEETPSRRSGDQELKEFLQKARKMDNKTLQQLSLTTACQWGLEGIVRRLTTDGVKIPHDNLEYLVGEKNTDLPPATKKNIITLLTDNSTLYKFGNVLYNFKTTPPHASIISCADAYCPCHFKPIPSNDQEFFMFAPELRKDEISRDQKIRRLTFGNVDAVSGKQSKTILLIGETGVGKSTFIDCLFNTLLGIRYEDKVRLKLVSLTEAEAENTKERTSSITDWITIYQIGHGPYHTAPFTITIIDTPGFGSTEGLRRDEETNIQFRSLFEKGAKYGIKELDAICFIINATTNKLSPVQSYIFGSVLSVFGNDLADVMFLCTTFTSSFENKIPAIEICLKEEVPHKGIYRFQNSAFVTSVKSPGVEQEWLKSETSYRTFLEELAKTKAVSLQQTIEVGHQKKIFKNKMRFIEANLHELTIRNSQIEQIKKEVENYTGQHELLIKSFKPTTVQTPLSPLKYSAVCNKCNKECCYPCEKTFINVSYFCEQMGKFGFCRSCSCYFTRHSKVNYRITVKTEAEEVKATEEQLQNKGKFLEELREQQKKLNTELDKALDDARNCQNKLNKIALRPEVFTNEQYLDLLIESEKKSTTRDPALKSINISQYTRLKKRQHYMRNMLSTGVSAALNMVKSVQDKLKDAVTPKPKMGIKEDEPDSGKIATEEEPLMSTI